MFMPASYQGHDSVFINATALLAGIGLIVARLAVRTTVRHDVT
ncbi:MAG TPA: hypothetical protein VGI44_03330 [Acidimicrobiales bacterium]|jgi:hypothetical protein